MVESNGGSAVIHGVSWAAATLRALAECGLRTILLTGAPRPGGTASPRATEAIPALDYEENPGGFVVAAAAAIASTQRTSVLIVQADGARPDSRRLFGPPPRGGLWELADDLYREDVLEARAGLGLGDWLEILAARERTGDLTVHAGGDRFRLGFVRGSIRTVEAPAADRDALLSGHALRARTAELVLRLVEARDPDFRFTESRAPAPESGGAESCMDRLFHERLRDVLPHPYLEGRIAGCLTDTPLANLKLLASGAACDSSPAMRRPLEFLIRRIARGYDLILIDAPPVAPGGPTEVLAGLADAVLLVTGPAALESARVAGAVEELRRSGASLVGVVTDPSGPARRGDRPCVERPKIAPLSRGMGKGCESEKP